VPAALRPARSSNVLPALPAAEGDVVLHDLRPWIDAVERAIARHRLDSPGAYRRWLWQDPSGSRDLGLNAYGCADAANLLYTIGRFPSETEAREGFISALRGLQDPENGLFHEATHHEIHTTAHCVAALELFDAQPARALSGLSDLARADAVEPFLEGLAWRESPWLASHRGAGLYAALAITGAVSADWVERYFAWLWQESDPATGCWRRGAVDALPKGGPTLFPHLAGTFHYLFNLEHARRPLRHPAALIDTCLAVLDQKLFPLAQFVGFAEIDWVYCLNRARRQCAHRFEETQRALERFADRYVVFLLGLDLEEHDGLNDLHSLFGAVCALAELQTACPGMIRTGQPLRLVLDRRPFI
jgi:hypothetical protein